MATTSVYLPSAAVRGSDAGKVVSVQDLFRSQSAFTSRHWGGGFRECCNCTLGRNAGNESYGRYDVGLQSHGFEATPSKVNSSLKQAELSRDDLILPSVASQLEIVLQGLQVVPEKLGNLVIGSQEERLNDFSSSTSSSDESPSVSSCDSSVGRRKPWMGVRRRKRSPPLPPWTDDDFRQREKLILEAMLLEQSEERVSLDEVLSSWLGKITRVELTNLMKTFGRMKQADVALDIFYWMQKQRGRLKPNKHVYSTILGVLGRSSMVSQARELFDSLDLNSMNVIVYNAMISVYVKSGFFKGAWKLYEELCERGLEADEVTFNILFSGISNLDKSVDMASQLFRNMKLIGVSPGRYTYNTLIMLYSKAGRMKAARKMMEEMRRADILPDLCTFNTLINIHARAGQCEEAVSVFNTVKEVGMKPDTVTYTNLIQMFCAAHKSEEAINYYEEMLASDFRPDMMTYSLIVHLHGKAGRPKEAEQAFRQMQNAGYQPNVVTWSSLIQAYGKLGMLAELSTSFAEMQEDGCRPDAVLYNIVMNGYIQGSLPSKAACFFRQMLSQGIQPSEACYNTLIHAYAQVENLEEARKVSQQMQELGYRMDKLSRRFLQGPSLRAKRRIQIVNDTPPVPFPPTRVIYELKFLIPQGFCASFYQLFSRGIAEDIEALISRFCVANYSSFTHETYDDSDYTAHKKKNDLYRKNFNK